MFFTKGQAESQKYTGPRTKDGMIKWLSEAVATPIEGDL